MITNKIRITTFTTLIALLPNAPSAKACFWVTGTTYQGKAVTVSGLGAAYLLRMNVARNLREAGQEMQDKLESSTNYNDRSDYAVALAYTGRNKEAVQILQKLEQEQPGNYFIAANLGTALELAGDNDAALNWIREGIRRNPNSHHGTEWLHAKIIEAKIAQQKDSAYFNTHTILDLDPERVSAGLTVEGKLLLPKQIGEAIQDQLQERLQFVKPPDPAVASLLFDYAAVEAATNTLESAKGLLKMAVEYGYPSARVEQRTKVYDSIIAWRKTKHYITYSIIAFCAVIVTFKVFGALYKRRIFVLSSKDLPAVRHDL